MEEAPSQSARPDTPKASELPHLDASLPSLLQAVKKHQSLEKISFHTPGHKGRLQQLSPSLDLTALADLTELPGLDDLSSPTGAIRSIAQRASRLYGSAHTVLSVNGATLAMMSAIITVGNAQKGQSASILVPRNAHRCVIEALCLTDLTPIWYEPDFDSEFNVWGRVDLGSLAQALTKACKTTRVAMIVVVSPTYGGAISDIIKIAELANKHDVVLLVDEAHGAHHIDSTKTCLPASRLGAHLTAHSLHKTLSGLTQTGLLHVSADCPIAATVFEQTLLQLTSSSPSYLLMASIEATLDLLSQAGGERIDQLVMLGDRLRGGLREMSDYQVYDTISNTSTHVLFKHKTASSSALVTHLAEHGIFAEAELGEGVLLMLGLGTVASDVDDLLTALQSFKDAAPAQSKPNSRPAALIAAMTPYAATRLSRTTIPAQQALNRVAAEFLAPCPPGIPLVIPGQLLTREVLESTRKELISVVV